ncbi:hypothetical protein ABK040_007816 [Willaertia magna]
MNGIGTGDYEYIMMLIVYGILAAMVGGFLIRKWIVDKKIDFTTFEFCVTCIIMFILLRIGVVSFLLYLRLNFLQKYINSKNQNMLTTSDLDRTAQVYLVTWELLMFLGTCALFSSLTSVIYKWRKLLNGDVHSNTMLVIGLNAILFCVGIFCVCMQYLFEFQHYTWVHIVYYYCCINMFILGILFIYYCDQLCERVEKKNIGNEVTFQLYKHALYNKYSGVVCAACFIIRGLVMALDNVGYRYLQDGSASQVIWNLFFKYVCWIIPEMIVVLCLLFCIEETEEFHNVLAYIYNRNEKNHMNLVMGGSTGDIQYGEVPTVDVENLEDVIQVKDGVSDVELKEMKEQITNDKHKQMKGNRGGSDTYVRLEED